MTVSQFIHTWRVAPGSARGEYLFRRGYVLHRVPFAERSRATRLMCYSGLRLRSGAERRSLRATPGCGRGAEQSDAAAGLKLTVGHFVSGSDKTDR